MLRYLPAPRYWPLSLHDSYCVGFYSTCTHSTSRENGNLCDVQNRGEGLKGRRGQEGNRVSLLHRALSQQGHLTPKGQRPQSWFSLALCAHLGLPW